MLTLVSISNAADDLPPRRSRRGASLWGLLIVCAADDFHSGDDLPPAAGLADVSQQLYCR